MASAYGYERGSPPRYHRSSQDLYHMPNPAGSRSGTPRASSALNRKWVHRSHGDLTADTELQISYPQSSFYQDLYRKYPRAFQHRRESRELGRKLFNSQHHVRFEDDVDMADDRSESSLRSTRSERPLTNWDREVGLYVGHRSRSRVCMTSAEPSETGSVYSVKQRLQSNSQTLNKLLSESPLRRRFAQSEKGSSHYDSGTENEQPVNYHNSEKLRLRNRTHQRKVLQRKIDNKQNGAFDTFERVDAWSGRQSVPITHQIVSPRKHRRYLPKVPQTKNRHVDVNALISNTDLKIDTLLEKISMKTSNPDSPPDSAIDVDTPSSQSAVTTDRGSHSDGLNSNCTNSLSSSGKGVSGSSSGNDSGLTNSSDGRPSRHHSDENGLMCSAEETEVTDPLKDKDNILLLQEYGMLSEDEDHHKNIPSENEDNLCGLSQIEAHNTAIDTESKQIQEIVDNFTQSTANDESSSVPGQGLVQLFSHSSMNIHEGIPVTTANDIAERKSHDSTPTNEISNLNNSNESRSSVDEQVDVNSAVVIKSSAVGEENVNYNADDEEDIHDDIVVAIETTQADTGHKRTYQRDSDVDSGIGQSSTGTRSPMSTLPPRGRAKQRGVTTRAQPVRADHSLLHTRADVDSRIDDEVNLVQLSHDLSHDLKRRGRHSSDEKDDTIPKMGIAKQTTKEQNVAARYRRHRSPSPFVVTRKPSLPRPGSAPSFYPANTDMCVVNISLSDENVPEASSKCSKDQLSCQKAEIDSVREHFDTIPISGQKKIGATDIMTKSNSVDHLQQSPTDNSSNANSEDKNLNSTFTIESCPVQQRKYSSSSFSSSVSSSDTLKLSQVEIHKRSKDQMKDYDQSCRKLQYSNVNGKEIGSVSKIKSKSATHIDKTEQFDEIKNQGATHFGHLSDQHRHSVGDINTYEPVYTNGVTSDQWKVKADVYKVRTEGNGENNAHRIDNYIANGEVAEDEHEVGHTDEYITEVRGIYKPSVTSPRVKAKRLKLKSMFKNKKGSFNPGAVPVVTNERNIVNRIYARDVNEPGVRIQHAANTKDNIHDTNTENQLPATGMTRLSHRTYQNSPVVHSCSEDSSDVSVSDLESKESQITQKEIIRTVPNTDIEVGISKKSSQAIVLTSNPVSGKTILRNGNSRDLHNGAQLNAVSAKPILINSRHIERNRHGDQITDCHSNGVPVPPVRTKARNKNLPADLNFSKYKIQSTGMPEIQTGNLNSNGGHSLDGTVNLSAGRPVSHDQSKLPKSSSKRQHAVPVRPISTAGHPHSSGGRMTPSPSIDIQVMPIEKSNLEKSKNISGSKLSLFDKMGGLKTATKGKFKAMRKAMSLERGIDQVGKSPQGEMSGPGDKKNSHSGFPRIKKAPSLKSITSLFGRKKKRGKFMLDDPTVTSANNPTNGNMKRQQWSSCDSLSSPRQPMGKLVSMNLDGSQVIELTKPGQGPLGFFIAKGSQQYKNGVFVSRFSNEGPDRMFAGLMGVGDEILEINGTPVCDLSLDSVYKLMAASQTLVLKVFPLIARIDVVYPKQASRVANSADPDQTAPSEAG